MKNEFYTSHSSTFLGADANLIALLSYFASTIMNWIPVFRYISFFAPLIIFFIEKESSFVKFHAMQSFFLNIVSSIISYVYISFFGISLFGMGFGNSVVAATSFGIVSLITLIMLIISLIILVSNVIAMIAAFRYKEYHIPLIGRWAASIAHTN